MTQETQPKPTPRMLTSIWVDREKWAKFDDVAKANHRSRGQQLREMIERSVNEYERKPFYGADDTKAPV